MKTIEDSHSIEISKIELSGKNEINNKLIEDIGIAIQNKIENISDYIIELDISYLD